MEELSVYLRRPVQQRTAWRLRKRDRASEGMAVQYERRPGFRATGPRHVHEPYRAAQHFRPDQPDPARQWHRSISGRLRAEDHGIRRADRTVALVVRPTALRAARRSIP